jgi:hypothetical protein
VEELTRAEERKKSERHCELYAVLGLGVTVHKDGALDVMVGAPR